MAALAESTQSTTYGYPRSSGPGVASPRAALRRSAQKNALAGTRPVVEYAWHATRSATMSGKRWRSSVNARGPPTVRSAPEVAKRYRPLPASRSAQTSETRFQSDGESSSRHRSTREPSRRVATNSAGSESPVSQPQKQTAAPTRSGGVVTGA